MPGSIIISLIFFSLLFIFYELKPMIKNRDWKTLVVSSVLMTLSLIYGIDFALNFNRLPNPNRILYLVKPLAEDFENLQQAE